MSQRTDRGPARPHPRPSRVLVQLQQRAQIRTALADAEAGVAAKEARLAAGYPTRVFTKKTEELVARLAEIAPRLAAGPRVEVEVALDVRQVDAQLARVLGHENREARDAAVPGIELARDRLAGLGAPHWDPFARGAMVGLTRYSYKGLWGL